MREIARRKCLHASDSICTLGKRQRKPSCKGHRRPAIFLALPRQSPAGSGNLESPVALLIRPPPSDFPFDPRRRPRARTANSHLDYLPAIRRWPGLFPQTYFRTRLRGDPMRQLKIHRAIIGLLAECSEDRREPSLKELREVASCTSAEAQRVLNLLECRPYVVELEAKRLREAKEAAER